ncbi:MAG: DUF4397 domain-containing protein [Microbacteriaceae bacterium]|nr:DUF4397 domain-containing protein [Microbacteriaceae bacterium]
MTSAPAPTSVSSSLESAPSGISSRPRRRGRLARITAVTALFALGLFGAGSLSAQAATSETGSSGFVRVAHLSPDTKSVDVSLTALSGGTSLLQLKNVDYGTVSGYSPLAAGTYVVSMVPAGSAPNTKPIISASIDIVTAKTITVAVFGKNAALQAKVFQDDLTGPTAGDARIRLIPASTVTNTVSVSTTTGLVIASNAETGTATSYASVPAGPWSLQLTAPAISVTSPVQLANGSVNTLFVLDNASGSLTVKAVLDSAGVGAAPVGGVQTGGGARAELPLLGLQPVG